MAVERLGFTSDTTSGTSSFIRHWDELSTTTAPASAKRGAHSALTPEPAENSAISKPWIDSSFSGCTGGSRRPSDASPCRALGGERHDLLRREGALAQHLEHRGADGAGGAHDGDPHRLRHLRAVHARHVLGQHGVGAELERGVQLRTASSTCSSRTTQEILIGEVEIISMFTPASPRTVNVFAATPG